MRVLHCPKTVAGQAPVLARFERELGLDSRSVALIGSPFGYRTDEVLWTHGQNPLLLEVRRWQLLCRALRHYDVIHFNFGETFMPNVAPSSPPESVGAINPLIWSLYRLYCRVFTLRDLPFIKKLGKKVFVTFQGDDIRQGDYCLEHFGITHATEVGPEYYEPGVDAAKRKRALAFSNYADGIFASNPDLLHVLPATAEFLPYALVDPREWVPVPPSTDADHRPVVLHAPTDRRVKGTKYVIDAVERLKNEGVPLDFHLVEDLPYDEAKELYRGADLLVDQLFAGWYGSLAVELMALGKPVCAYIREGDLRFIPVGMREDLPVINVSKDSLYSVLKHWLTDGKHQLRKLGDQSRVYVEKWHDPLKIAERLRLRYLR